jgi:PBSX family phage terminase large subunit
MTAARGRHPAKPAAKNAAGRHIELRGGNFALIGNRDPEVILAGAAGTGKSISAALKLFVECEHTKGVRCLMVRKTRESLTESGLVTFEKVVRQIRGMHACLRGPTRKLRQAYRFPNGSEIVIGGIDKASKILSTEFDLIYVQEATELTEDDWETLTTRLRNGKLPYQQIFADCNPGAPSHWIKKRCDAGRATMLQSRHEDNPGLFDKGKGEWTPEGVNYIAKLDALTGARLARLRHGRWAQAEGAVYPEWDATVHVIGAEELPGGGPYPPPEWDRMWAIDFGYTDPFVWQCFALDNDRRMYLYKEIFRTGVLVEDHARRIQQLWGQEAEYWARARKIPVDSAMRMVAPRAGVVCDHNAQERATLERHLGVSTVGARKLERRKGIQAVSGRLRDPGDGLRRLYIVRGGLDCFDQALDDAKKPRCTIEELDAYVWNPDKDEPVAVNDHGCDALRYAVVHADQGFGTLWEPASVVAQDRAEGAPLYRVLDGEPKFRYGDATRERRGKRLFGGGA